MDSLSVVPGHRHHVLRQTAVSVLREGDGWRTTSGMVLTCDVHSVRADMPHLRLAQQMYEIPTMVEWQV